MKKALFFNFLNLDMTTNLGVSKYCLALIKIIRDKFDVFALIEDQASRESEIGKEISKFAKGVVSTKEALGYVEGKASSSVEVLIHHFKRGVLPIKRIVICHDIHVIDVPWKYENVEKHVENMKVSLKQADAVITHFPRTYYEVERSLSLTIQNLFITPEILMTELRTPSASEVDEVLMKFGLKRGFLFYPAQLQKHKGHAEIIRAVAELKDLRQKSDFKIVFCGSDFDKAYTDLLLTELHTHKLDNVCKFLGRVSEQELACLYTASRGVFVASRAEGGALVALEAAHYGKPVAVNRIAAAEMHLKMHGVQCRWFNIDEISSIREALEFLWEHGAVGEREQNGGLAAFRQESISKRANLIVDAWERIATYLLGHAQKPFPCLDSSFNVIRYI